MLKGIKKYFSDFGLLDYMIFYANQMRLNKISNKEDYNIYYFNMNSNGNPWICFTPWRTSLKNLFRFNLIPEKSPCIVFHGPNALINPDPKIARKYLFEIVKNVKSFNLKSFNVLGLSAGNYLAWYVANHFNCDKFISVSIASKLGVSIWEGIATQNIRKKSQELGYLNSEDYDEVLSGTNPIDNLDNIPENSVFYLGKFDKYIPSKNSNDLLKKLKIKRKKFKLIDLKKSGHISTLIYFGKFKKI